MALISSTYPSKTFSHIAKSTLNSRADLRVEIRRKWIIGLLSKSIAIWPSRATPVEEFASRADWSWTLSNLIFPTLFVIHWAFTNAGYKRSYSLQRDLLQIEYQFNACGTEEFIKTSVEE